MIRTHTRVFDELLAAVQRRDLRYIDNAGGTRSGKTFATLQLLVLLCKGSQVPSFIASVVSETMPHLKRGAIRDFKEIMADEWNEASWSKVDSIYTFSSGAILEFFSADNPGKVHGPGRDVLFINEANHIDWDTVRQLLVRTRDLAIFDYNPTHTFWVHENIQPRPNCASIHSTYLDNLENLTAEQVAEIESNRRDEAWWRVYGEGKIGELEGLIFPDLELVDALPDGESLREVYGMDYGFTNDPTVLLHLKIDQGRRIIYADEICYRKGMLNRDIADAMAAAGVPLRSVPIFADSAEPKTNAELAGYGYNIRPSYKATRKAEQLQMMRGYRLCVTKRSLETIKEARGYCWAKDRDGRTLNEPQAFNDHAMDALRYGAFTYITGYVNKGRYNISFGD